MSENMNDFFQIAKYKKLYWNKSIKKRENEPNDEFNILILLELRQRNFFSIFYGE